MLPPRKEEKSDFGCVFPGKGGTGVPGRPKEGLFVLGSFPAGAAVHPDVAVPEFGGKFGLFPFVQNRFSPKSIGCGEGGAAEALLEVGLFPEDSGSFHRALITKNFPYPLNSGTNKAPVSPQLLI